MPPKPAADDSDDEFELSAPAVQSSAASAAAASSSSTRPTLNKQQSSHLTLPRRVLDRPYDEAVEVSASSADSVMSADIASPVHGRVVKGDAAAGKVLAMEDSEEEEEEEEEDEADEPALTRPPAATAAASSSAPPKASPKGSPQASPKAAAAKKPPVSESEEDDGGDDDDDDEEETGASPASSAAASSPSRAASHAKLYNLADFAHLSYPADVTALLPFISAYKPVDIELDTKFLPFIPDYIPAIGEIDAFLKPEPPQPLGVGLESLGLTVVDEPCSRQSDVSALTLQLNVLHKGIGGAASTASVPKIEDAAANGRKVTRWIESVTDVHQQKPQARVHYSNEMPDIERLMQAWPPQLESAIAAAGAELGQGLDLSVKEMAELCCALMSIPVHGDDKLVESLHVLFSLYQEFCNNAHFQQM